MGRLIDETNLMNLLYALDDARHDLCYAIKKIPELPTVEAIPKDQYENRLKADMVSVLTELRQEIDIMSDTVVEGRTTTITSWKGMKERICKLIQSKIDKLKENNDETDRCNK